MYKDTKVGERRKCLGSGELYIGCLKACEG
jgi:hypothetical protein